MTLEEQFHSATQGVQSLTRRPSNEELLLLYALFKQGSEGDVTGERPMGFDFKAIAKWQAWSDQKGKSKEAAMQEYIQLADRLKTAYS
ncbi:MAG: acyl-CoA-binding protein [Bacteroidetes bacterium]|nr:acyl-CoA-binding protein [Bacteroidota bacterium]